MNIKPPKIKVGSASKAVFALFNKLNDGESHRRVDLTKEMVTANHGDRNTLLAPKSYLTATFTKQIHKGFITRESRGLYKITKQGSSHYKKLLGLQKAGLLKSKVERQLNLFDPIEMVTELVKQRDLYKEKYETLLNKVNNLT